MLCSFTALTQLQTAAREGELGKARDLLIDVDGWVIRYLEVETGLQMTGQRLLIPVTELQRPDWDSGAVRVNMSAEQIENGPRFEDAKPVSRQEEERLHSYYGWQPYWTDSDQPGAGNSAPVPPGDEMTGDRQAESIPDDDQPMASPEVISALEVVGYRLEANGGLAGHLADLILDDESWMVRYLVIDTGDDNEGKQVLVATQLADRVSFDTFAVYADVKADVVRGGPEFDPSLPINEEYEEVLQDHFGY